MSKNVLLRDVPNDLVDEIDRFSRNHAGEGGKPSRDRAAQTLIRKGLGVSRGDVGTDGTKREA